MKSRHLTIILISILLSAVLGCKPNEKIAPDFPPEESISIDFSYFINPPIETSNYAHAFETSLSWISLLNDSLQLYQNMLNVVSQKNFNYQNNNTWLINSILYSGDNQYDVNYFEIINIDTIDTKLFFTLDSSYTNLLLFDGYFLPDSTNGFRQINKPDTGNTSVKFLKIDWNIISESKKEVKFTNLLVDDKNGNSVLYKDSTDNQYDVYLDFFDKASENHTFIEYSKTNFSGRIKDLKFYGDENWYCWDTNRENTDCSSE